MVTPEQHDRLIFEALTRRPLRVVCAWCPDFRPPVTGETGVTHGICPACAAKLAAEGDPK